MKFLVAFAALAVFVSLNVAAQSSSSGTSTVTINGLTIQTTSNNGKTEYTINGKPVSEQEAKEIMAQNGVNMGSGSISSGMINGRPMTPEEQQAFEKKMEEFRNNMAKQMEEMRKKMQQAFANMGKPGWPFNQ